MTNQGSFQSGQVLDAASLNAFACVTMVEGSSSVANNTNTTLTFATEVIDVDNWFTSGGNTITPTLDGIYAVVGNGLNFNSANRALINIRHDGDVIASQDNSTGAFDLSCMVYAKHTVDQAGFQLQVYQNSGSTVNPFFRFAVHLVRAL